jgi:hypothetical protein
MSKFDDADLPGWCKGTKGFIPVRGIYELGGPIVRDSGPTMYMPENMHQGFPSQCQFELGSVGPSNAIWWSSSRKQM